MRLRNAPSEPLAAAWRCALLAGARAVVRPQRPVAASGRLQRGALLKTVIATERPSRGEVRDLAVLQAIEAEHAHVVVTIAHGLVAERRAKRRALIRRPGQRLFEPRRRWLDLLGIEGIPAERLGAGRGIGGERHVGEAAQAVGVRRRRRLARQPVGDDL